MTAGVGQKMENREWGMGSGEWGVGSGEKILFPTPHSLFLCPVKPGLPFDH